MNGKEILLCLAVFVFLFTTLIFSQNMNVYTAPVFTMELWPDSGPSRKKIVDADSPLNITAARGETESALIALQARKPISKTVVENPAFSGSGIKADTRAIIGIRRATTYSSMAGLRYPDRYNRVSGMILPDILHSDEEAVLSAILRWDGAVPAPRQSGRTLLGAVKEKEWKYVLVTVCVPETVSVGIYKSVVKLISDGSEQFIPVQITVRPFILERNHGRLVGISSEFSDTSNLLVIKNFELMRDMGLTFTRIAPITSRPDAGRWFDLLRRHGIRVISQNRPPRQAGELRNVPADFRCFFYGIDEPQPKDRERKDWRKMAEHVKLSARVHAMGGLVMTSIPYSLAMELTDRKSRLYSEVSKLGVSGAYEPLDWANIGLGVQQLGRDRRAEDRNEDFYSYVSSLQGEFNSNPWNGKEIPLRKKHPWIETYYFPHGLSRYAVFGRLLFGYYLFNSKLDGAMAWTMYRVPEGSPFGESNLPIATLAYPGNGEIYGTYSLEALREGIDDLCYANQAYLAIRRCLEDEKKKNKGEELKKIFISAMAPYFSLMPGGKRIDLAIPEIEESVQSTREILSRVIIDASAE
ncbi:MAG TPA: hypothetical protein PKN36_10200 [bacterium]|nr:hypothetical protein [bacterium]